MQIWYLAADFIANMSLPHKRETPNDFHWVGGFKIRPLIITHPGIDKSFCYIWGEIDGNKGENLPASVRVLYLTVDNCAGNFKNNIVLRYLGLPSCWSHLYGSRPQRSTT